MRKLDLVDIDSLMLLVDAAHWNQTPADWLRLLSLAPDLCLGIERDGNIVSSATATPYGSDLAWIGMILTLPEHRGQGLARTLFAALLDRLSGTRTLKLDATSQGLALYRHFGFVEEGVVRRWKGILSASSSCPPAWPGPLDREAFGADRSALLHALGSCLRPGRRASYLGPLVARRAADLILPSADGEVYWDILDSNRAAVTLAASLGFQPFRRLVRMRQGPPLDCREDFQFAIAGFEYG